MPFQRALVSGDSHLPQPMRAGAGFLANVRPTNFNAEADATLTVAQLAGGAIVQGLTLTSAVVYTLPTAADIIAAWPEMDVGDAYTFYVGNNQAAAYAVTIAVGTGITAVGTNNNLSVVAGAGKMFTLVKTSATAMQLY